MLKYPNDWAIVHLKDAINGAIVIDPQPAADDLQKRTAQGGGFGLDKHSAVIQVYGLPNNTDINSLSKSNTYQTVTKQNIIVGGQSAIQYKITFLTQVSSNLAGDTVYMTVISHQGEIIALQVADTQYKQVYDQILSTFQFTQ